MSRRRDEKIAAMKQEIERRGGMVHISEALPAALVERFLREVLDCPDCRAEAGSRRRRDDS
jgi:hypothetical protein